MPTVLPALEGLPQEDHCEFRSETTALFTPHQAPQCLRHQGGCQFPQVRKRKAAGWVLLKGSWELMSRLRSRPASVLRLGLKDPLTSEMEQAQGCWQEASKAFVPHGWPTPQGCWNVMAWQLVPKSECFQEDPRGHSALMT